jgi:hypothetical protein
MEMAQTAARFEVSELANGRYHVIDTTNDQPLRFSFSLLYGSAENPASEWNNYYAARGFSQRLAAKVEGA